MCSCAPGLRSKLGHPSAGLVTSPNSQIVARLARARVKALHRAPEAELFRTSGNRRSLRLRLRDTRLVRGCGKACSRWNGGVEITCVTARSNGAVVDDGFSNGCGGGGGFKRFQARLCQF